VDKSRVSLNDAEKAGRRFGSKAYSKEGTKGKRDKTHCSVVPFVNAARDTISVFYVLASTDGQNDVYVPHHTNQRDGTGYREYHMVTQTGYTNGECFKHMMAQFEKKFHMVYPGLRAVVYMDRLGSHCTAELKVALEEKQVAVVLFPPGTTQFLQPLDDAVFALFKNLCASTATRT